MLRNVPVRFISSKFSDQSVEKDLSGLSSSGLRTAIAAAALCLTGSVLAVNPFTISDIRVEGVERVEPSTIFNYLPVHVGDTFTDEKGTEAIRSLYGTGLFKDVRVEAQGSVMVVSVQERPVIGGIDFDGTKEFEKAQLGKALKDMGVIEARAYDRSAVSRAEQELKRQYISRGFYNVQITTTVTPLERNRVNVNFHVVEGERARIRGIRFVGNQVYSDKKLRDEIRLTTPGWFTWYSKNDQYTREKLQSDIDALRNYYLDHGYIEAQITSSQVSISPDKKEIYITLNIIEGRKYTVSKVTVGGQTLGRDKELMSLVELKEGQTFSGKALANSLRRMKERMGSFGYAFVNINENPSLDQQKQTVAFNFLIDPGKRAYVRNVNISGNTKTRDEVIRREFRQFENSWYDGDKINLSRDRVDRLGFFKEVTTNLQPVANSQDQVDVETRVTEKETGGINFGVGYSQADKVSLTGSITQDNAFGSGNRVALQANTSARYRTISLSQTNPYFTDDGVSRTFNVYMNTQRPSIYANSQSDYRVRTLGANTEFGVPFSEVDTVFFGGGVERVEVQTSANSPSLYKQYVADFGGGTIENGGTVTTNSFPLTLRWQRDSRNSALAPTAGRFQSFSLELSAVGTLKYYRASYKHQYLKQLFDDAVVLQLNGQADYGRGIGNAYPVFKNYYAGGISSVRGYEDGSLGNNFDQYGDAMGGASRLLGSAELQFPFPGAGKDRTLRWFTFFDAGQVYADRTSYNLGELRYSTGLGISYLSPIGPLKLSYGIPLNPKFPNAQRQTGDRKQSFQFQIGNSF